MSKDMEEKKTERLQIKLSLEEKEKLRWLSELDNRSMSNYLLNLLDLAHEIAVKKIEED